MNENVMSKLHSPVGDQSKFVASRNVITICNDLSQMNIQQILRYTSSTSNLYLAVYISTQVKNVIGVNFRAIIEVNG